MCLNLLTPRRSRFNHKLTPAACSTFCLLQVTPTLALYDTMQYVRSPTATVCYGMCLGMGGFLLTAGGEKVSAGWCRHTSQ